MSKPEEPTERRDQLLEEAALWFARMRGPDAEACRGEFEAWLRRGALHRAAYNRASEIFAMGKLLGEEAQAPRPRPRRTLRVALPALAAAAALLAAGWMAFGEVPLSGDRVADAGAQPGLVQRWATGASEVRTVRLSDGSLVRLRPSSQLEARIGPQERRLLLSAGEARFKVHREVRPFIVEAGGGRVIARGTVFDVALLFGRRVMVRLVEGRVDVLVPEAGSPSRPSVRRLAAGETVSFAAAPAPVQEAAGRGERDPDTADGGAVRDYEDVSLAALIEAANAHGARRIMLAEPAIGERRVSGRFRTDDSLLLAERLALLFDLRIDSTGPDEIVLTAH